MTEVQYKQKYKDSETCIKQTAMGPLLVPCLIHGPADTGTGLFHSKFGKIIYGPNHLVSALIEDVHLICGTLNTDFTVVYAS